MTIKLLEMKIKEKVTKKNKSRMIDIKSYVDKCSEYEDMYEYFIDNYNTIVDKFTNSSRLYDNGDSDNIDFLKLIRIIIPPYQCPTCKENYTQLQAQRLLSGDYKFVCSHCCPKENFRNSTSEPYYRLVEIDNRGKLNKGLI